MMGRFAREVLRLLFPPKCISCGELMPFRGFGWGEPKPLCRECHSLWEAERGVACAYCGSRVDRCLCLPAELKKAKCVELHKLVYYLHGTRSAVQNRMIYRIKDSVSSRALGFFSRAMGAQARECMRLYGLLAEDAVIVYLPRSRRALLEKGTDQGKRLAYALSRETGIEVLRVIRRRWGRDRFQKELDFAERRKNAKVTYTVTKGVDLTGRSVFLVDDIVTTGASMAAAVRLLKKLGATRFYCFALATDDINQRPQVKQPSFQI